MFILESRNDEEVSFHGSGLSIFEIISRSTLITTVKE